MDNKKVDTRDSLKIVTSNDLLKATGLQDIDLTGRKLLYLAIAQCKMTDAEFLTYSLTVKEFADIIGIDPSNVYRTADEVTDRLMDGKIKLKADKYFDKFHLFDRCKYSRGVLTFKIHDDMAPFILKLKKNFSQMQLSDIVKMRSNYSVEIWRLINSKMNSKKPYGNTVIEFELRIDELREITGTQKKFMQLGQFKQYVFDKALREIRDNCYIDIEYRPGKKEGKRILSFICTAKSRYFIDMGEMSEKVQKKVRFIELNQKYEAGILSPEEEDERESLTLDLGQITIFDYIE